ncbi:hypothetical protein IQ07DRAFT_362433 [Pyrenochaeta sp. DS3sAY3a]|nr:hypothetical protein IQ07DRAFT_362433 [Pyrenochaeta sp. DS3sAY3a]
MPKKTGTVHHCPGRNGWVADIPPGSCRVMASKGQKNSYCHTHQRMCPQGCDRVCLKSQPGCGLCVGRWAAEARAEKAEASSKDGKEDDFFNPPKERRKPKAEDKDKTSGAEDNDKKSEAEA